MASTPVVVGCLSSSARRSSPRRASLRGRPPRRSDARRTDRRHADDPVLLFVADGLRQDLVERYLRPTRHHASAMASLLRSGVVGLGGRPVDPGAAEHGCRLVQPRDRSLAGRHRLDEQHVPRQRPALRQSHHRLRCGRAPGRVDRPVGGARRARRSSSSSSPAVAARARKAPRSTSGASSPVAASRRTTSRRPTTRPSRRRSGCSSTTRPGFAGQAPYPQAAPTDATGWTNVPQSYSPAKEMHLRVLDFRRRQVRPRRLHLRQPRRRPHQVQPGALLADEGRQPGRRHAPRRAMGRHQGADRRRDVGGSDRGLPHQGRDARQGPLRGPVVPHVGGARARHVAHVARRSGVHRELR